MKRGRWKSAALFFCAWQGGAGSVATLEGRDRQRAAPYFLLLRARREPGPATRVFKLDKRYYEVLTFVVVKSLDER